MNPDRIPEWIRNGPSIIGRFGGAALLGVLACQADAPAQKTAGDNLSDRISGQLNVDSLPSELAFMRNVVVEETPTPIPTLTATPTPEPVTVTATATATAIFEPTATPQPDRASQAGGGGAVEVPTVRPCLPGDLTAEQMPKKEFYVSKGAEVKLKARPEPDSEVVGVVGEGTKLNNVCGLKTITDEAGKSLYPRLVEVENDGPQGWVIVGQDRVQDTKPNLAPAPPAPTRVPTPVPPSAVTEEEQAVPSPETVGASCTIPDGPNRRKLPAPSNVYGVSKQISPFGFAYKAYEGYFRELTTTPKGWDLVIEVLGVHGKGDHKIPVLPNTPMLIQRSQGLPVINTSFIPGCLKPEDAVVIIIPEGQEQPFHVVLQR